MENHHGKLHLFFSGYILSGTTDEICGWTGRRGGKILGSALGPVTSSEIFLKKITASVLNLRIWLEEVLETSARYQLRMGWRTFVQICSGYKVASYEHERLEFNDRNWVQKACVRLHWHNPISNFKEAIHANMNFKRKHFIKNENVFA